MGCFLGCFGGRKNQRRQKRRESDQARANNLSVEYAKPVHRVSTAEEEIPKSSVIPITDICDEAEEKSSPSPTRKRVTFDSIVKTHQHIADSQELLLEEKQDVVSLNPSKTAQSSSSPEVASNPSAPYPTNDRYKNCRESDDDDDDVEEDDDLYCGESDLDDEFYSDEAFSEDNKQTKEDAKLRSSNESVQGVLNPVENLTQWRSAKASGKTVQKLSQKENSNNLISDQEDKKGSFSFGADSHQTDDTTLHSTVEPKRAGSKELTVDASLSTWLSPTSETGSECNSVSYTPEKNKSTSYSKWVINSHDDRPVLCALTSEDIKQFSAASTPRKSPRKSPDETPIIGTVGGYWGNHSKAVDSSSTSSFKGIPNTTSKYREDKSVNWHSTPFEARLEKALNRDK